MRPLCIYHGACDDGFAAAWVVRKALDGNVDFHPGVHGQGPPPCANRDVIMVDFSYKRSVIDRLGAEARSILISDHHKTAQEDLRGLIDPPQPSALESNWDAWKLAVASIDAPRVGAIFDMNRSGATMAWDYFIGGKRPEFIEYVEDRDLWRKAKMHGDEFTIALRSYPQTFEAWDRLFLNSIDGSIDDNGGAVGDLINEGRSIQRYYRARVDELKAQAYRAIFQTGHSVWVCNAPYFAASEVAGELADDGVDFGACYFRRADGKLQYSLRSRGDFDVSEVAKTFGGGGHKNAAGFESFEPVHMRVGNTVTGMMPKVPR